MRRNDKKRPGLAIRDIESDSIAQDLGWAPSDRIVAINDQPVRDPLDYRFLVGQEEVNIEIEKADGERILFEVEKDADDSLGADFAPIAPDRCGNQCTFCFVHQMPKGMRRSLYIKDEDFRLSFLAGHFTTMATITDAEIERIVTQRLSPQYISVHATGEELRRVLLGNPTSRPILPTLDRFIEGGIELHTQIVLMPGENDGSNLDRSLEDLLGRYPGVQSVAIVPVGLTKFREKLPHLDYWTPEISRPVLDQVQQWQIRSKKQLGENIIFVADEFYVVAGEPVPAARHYGEWPQLGNGVGMIRRFLDGVEKLRKRKRLQNLGPIRAHLLTGRSAAPVVAKLAEFCNTQPRVQISVLPIENRFFGGDVTCSGLLTAQDIVEQSAGAPPGDLILPDILMGESEESRHLLLDDVSIPELSKRTGRKVHVIAHEAEPAYEELLELSQMTQWSGDLVSIS